MTRESLEKDLERVNAVTEALAGPPRMRLEFLHIAEDRSVFHPSEFHWVQITYGTVRAGYVDSDEEAELAYFGDDGCWHYEDERYTDVSITPV